MPHKNWIGWRQANPQAIAKLMEEMCDEDGAWPQEKPITIDDIDDADKGGEHCPCCHGDGSVATHDHCVPKTPQATLRSLPWLSGANTTDELCGCDHLPYPHSYEHLPF